MSNLFKFNMTKVYALCALIILTPVAAIGGETEEKKIMKAVIEGAVVADEKKQLIDLNLHDVNIKDAVAALCKQAGINVIIDKNIDQNLAVNAVYQGISVDGAIKSIISGLDIAFKKQDNVYYITPYEERYIDVNKLMILYGGGGGSASTPVLSSATTGSGQGLNPAQGAAGGQQGGQAGQQQGQTGQGGQAGQIGQQGMGTGAGTSASTSSGSGSGAGSGSDFGGYIESVINNIGKIKSPSGVITYLPSGFIYVKDYPSKVRSIEKMLSLDDEKRETVNLKITIIRIDYHKNHETGVNWKAVLGGQQKGKTTLVDIGGDFTSAFGSSNVYTLKFSNALDTLGAVMKAMSEYGDVSIVHSWETKAVAGTILPFSLTQTVWYKGASTVQVINNQTITTNNVASTQTGLQLTINPVRFHDLYLVNTEVTMSSIVGKQVIDNAEYPNLEQNYVAVPIKMKLGETVAISGFRINSSDKQKIGLPWLSSIPVISSLFGYTKSEDKTSELTVLITL